MSKKVLEYTKLLAFLRPDLFKKGLDIVRDVLRETAIDNEKVKRFYDYVERYWLPLAKVVSVWGIAVFVNNICETYHMLLNHESPPHPRVWQMNGKLNELFYSSAHKKQLIQKCEIINKKNNNLSL